MDDSDDSYFLDSDLVLDEKTLAVLDEEESKYKRVSNTQPRQSVGPPAKRQKTSGSWQPRPTSKTLHRTDTSEDLEDLPDVSIRQDGTYGIQDKQRGPTGPPSRPGVAPLTGPNVARAASGTGSTVASSLSRGPAPPVRGTSVVGSTRAAPARPPSATHATRIARSPASSQGVSRTQSSPPQRVNSVPSTTVSGNYVDQLRQQIEELRKENKAIHTEMESALETKFAKEGEVTILRKRLEKTAQDHIAQVAKLKAAKDEADAKHVLLQKQYEADRERLRTELTFRRHELETSSRRDAVALSPKGDAAQSTGSRPFQRQRSSQWGSAGPSRPEPETPRRPRFGVISDFERQKKPNAPEARALPSGFQTGPPRSQFVDGRKRKETAASNAPVNASLVIPSATPLESNNRFPQSDVFGTQMDDAGPVEEFILPVDGGNDDVHMVDAGTPAMTRSSQESTTVLVLSNWSLVLHDIMLTHKRQESELPTLQLLVSMPPADTGQIPSYGAVLMRIFDTLGGIPAYPDRDFDDLSQGICCALCEITELLARNNLIFPLTAVLNLLTNLTYMLPPIHALLLSRHVSDQDETPQLLGVLHNIIQDRLQTLEVSTENESPEFQSLGKETLALYEALVWSMSDDLEDCLGACPKMSSLITTLLCPHRPPWFLIGSMRVLLWLSTRRNLSRSLLSHPTSERTAHDGESVGPTHLQIALVCSLLIDTDRQGPEADELKSHIIMFFGMLSSAHPDIYTLLVESQELIPSIVLYLCHLVAPIWDEDGVILNDPLAATRTIRIVNHATLLLHHLVTGEDTTLDLRERLLCASPKTYQGLIHYFILTFGRLSYANPPYWLDEQDRERLMGVADLARALLERVIQGPELDLIWETYQDEGEENNDTVMDVDDEEVEAQKIADS